MCLVWPREYVIKYSFELVRDDATVRSLDRSRNLSRTLHKRIPDAFFLALDCVATEYSIVHDKLLDF